MAHAQQLGRLTALTALLLSRGRLSGTLPRAVAKLPRLVQLSVASNRLSGELPLPLFAHNFSLACALAVKGDANCFSDTECPDTCACHASRLDCEPDSASSVPHIESASESASSALVAIVTVAAVAGVLGVIFCLAAVLILRKRQQPGDKTDGDTFESDSDDIIVVDGRKIPGRDAVMPDEYEQIPRTLSTSVGVEGIGEYEKIPITNYAGALSAEPEREQRGVDGSHYQQI